MTTLIRSPYETLSIECVSALAPTSLRLAANLDLATIIGDSEDGVSLAELAKRTGIEEEKIGIVGHQK